MPSTFIVRRLGFSYLRGRKVSEAHLLLLALSDRLLLFVFGREPHAPAPPLEGKRLVVAKIDHLGDVLMITPLLAELRAQAPSCRVELMLGSWCRDLGEMLREQRLCDEVFYYDAPTLNKAAVSWPRKVARGIATFRESVQRLRGADLFLELRPFSPNAIFAARLAHIPHKIGFGLRGCSFFLQQELPYAPERSLGDLFLGALPLLGLKKTEYRKPILLRPGTPRVEVDGVSLPGRFLAVHPFSLEQARMTRDDFWARLITQLTASIPVVVLGSATEATSSLATRLKEMPGVIPLTGRTTFREAVETVAGAGGFVGVDSVFSHVALAFDLPTLVLLTRGAGLRASFPMDNSRLLFVDPDGPEASAESVAAAFSRLRGAA